MAVSLRGVGVALVTPFDEKGKIDFISLEKLLKHVSNGGVDYLVVMGTTAESATLSFDEKAEVLSFVKSHNPNNLPIVYGLGGNNTRAVCDDIKKSDLSGVTAILSVCPYYNKPSQEGLFQHFSMIAETSPVPVILYNVPGRTSLNIAASTVQRLSTNPNIIGIKEAGNDTEQIMNIISGTDKDFLLISGDDLFTLPMLSMEAAGVISVLANAIPEVFRDMIVQFNQGNIKEAKKEALRFLKLNPLMYRESNPVGIKHLLHEMNVCKNHVRLPLVAASNELQNDIKREYENYKNMVK
ncbi:MAG: 4-hydroxy-tetrahydrodipicolinate synthase [Cyclobacteriaceae bacterium]|nr:4-hydroxy-tetrahydrodipicolinate synthase [Cyclobacteriaceae bacterium]